MSESPHPIDVRAPRFAATLTSLLLAVTFVVALSSPQPATDIATRALQPAFLVLATVAALFAWGVLSPRTAPFGVLFRTVVAPRLTPASEFEDPRPPRFAQGVGLAVVLAGIVLHLTGIPFALAVAAALAFVAAFLNAVFGFCLGCVLYLAFQRVRRPQASV